MSKYCKQCGAKLDDNVKFCENCGTECDDVLFVKTNTKLRIKYAVIGITVLIAVGIIAAIVSGFSLKSKKENNKTQHKATDVKKKEDDGLKRISKEYEYNLVGEDVQQCDKWFLVSDELFGVLRDTLYHFDQDNLKMEEIGEMDEYIPCSGKNEWLVFKDNDYVYKYNIQNKSIDAIAENNSDEFGSAVVINNILYYYSEKEIGERDKPVSPMYNPNRSIWAYNLSDDSDNKIIENVRVAAPLVCDSIDDQYFYFTMEDDEEDSECWGSLARYDCTAQTSEIIDEQITSENLVAYNGTCYSIGSNLLLIRDGQETCLKENWNYSQYICRNGYLIFNGDMMDKVIVVDGENIYEIDKTWSEDWSYGAGDIIFAQDQKIWFVSSDNIVEDNYSVYSVDFDGNMLPKEDWITLQGGRMVLYFDNNLWAFGQPQEEWEINKEVDNSVVDEIEKKGYDVASFGEYEGGKTELTINVGPYGLYKIPIDEEEKKNEKKETGKSKDTQSQDDKLYQQKKALKDKKTSTDISYAELVQNLQSYQGKWSDFGQQNDAYQRMIKDLVESSIDLSDYFSGDVDELDTIITAFHGGLDNTDEAECAVQLYGTSKDNGEYTELCGVVSLDESGNIQFVINYVGAAR